MFHYYFNVPNKYLQIDHKFSLTVVVRLKHKMVEFVFL